MATDRKLDWYAALTPEERAWWDELDQGEDYLNEDDENLVVFLGGPEKKPGT